MASNIAAAAADDPWSNYDPSQAPPSPLAEANAESSSAAGNGSASSKTALATEARAALQQQANGDAHAAHAAEGSQERGGDAEEEEEEEEEDFSYPGAGGASDLLSAPQQGNAAQEEEDEEDESFSYPGASQPAEPAAAGSAHADHEGEEDDEEEFVYSGADTSAAADTSVEPASSSSPEPASVPPEDPVPVRATPEPAAAPDAATEPSARAATPRPIDYARLASLCSNGPLAALQSFFTVTCAPAPAGAGVTQFALANETSPTTGLAPVHYAAREGQLDVLRWLVEEAGALVDLEDREGETALHKVALRGRLAALKYLLDRGADPQAEDADGWTALHNACSMGYLDLVKLLVERAGADPAKQAKRGGWTPLMNAASKGHLPIVRYLTAKHGVDPFARNHAGETAYDIAAATFEVYICEVLQRYEQERWAALRIATAAGESSASVSGSAPAAAALGKGAYNPLALHAIVPVVLHENQRLDTRLQTLALNGGKPRWSHQSAARPHKPDRRAPGTMPPGPLAPSKARRHVPCWREDVGLPTRKEPHHLRINLDKAHAAAGRASHTASARRRTAARAHQLAEDQFGSTPTPESVLRRAAGGSEESSGSGSEEAGAGAGAGAEETSHFWLSDWQMDRSHPFVDVESGWQYAQSFDTPEERWSAEVPPPLQRLLEGKGLGASVTRALSGGVAPGPGAVPVPASVGGSAGVPPAAGGEQDLVASGWVRRRRWVRVMRRRLDIDFDDDLAAAEAAGLDTALSVAAAADASADGNGDAAGATLAAQSVVSEAQQAARADAAKLGPDADYTARAAAIAGVTEGTTPADAMGDGSSGLDEVLRRITRLTLAIEEIRSHAFSDAQADRRGRAEDLLKEYTVQLGQLRQAANFDGDSDESDAEGEGEDEDEEEFIYPNSYKDDGASVFTRIAPRASLPSSFANLHVRPSVPQRSSSAASALGNVTAPSEAGTSAAARMRSADLAASREFRVPTRENSSSAVFTLGSGPRLVEQRLQPQWESDSDVRECRGCSRKFTFFVRKHHCRRCGRIFCDSCSSHRAHLPPSELVTDPAVPEMALEEQFGPSRVCANCSAELQLPARLQTPRGADALARAAAQAGGARASGSGGGDAQQWSSGEDEYGLPRGGGLGRGRRASGSETPLSDASSRASELTECPVCSKALAPLGTSSAQEEHVRTCLENGGGGSVQGGRYLVYKLPEHSPIVGKECVICMEDFVVESTIARLPCLCFFHRACIDSWIKRGKACPVHARTW